MTTTILLPVSREEHLARVFAALELMHCDSSSTGLYVYVDGNDRLYNSASRYTEASKFASKACLQRPQQDGFRNLDLSARRLRVARIHNELREQLPHSDYVLLVEDDTVVPAHALAALQSAYVAHPFAGLVSGVQVGRHGIPHLGLWSADDVYEPSLIRSVLMGDGVQEIDATGLYCALVKADNYLKHDFKSFGLSGLGPDVDLGISLRQQGLKNFVDFSVRCDHRTKDKVITIGNSILRQVIMHREGNNWVREIR